MQLGLLSRNIPIESAQDSNLIKYLLDLFKFIDVISILASLLLVIPATNAITEYSFSSLQSLKSNLRPTMTQAKPNETRERLQSP